MTDIRPIRPRAVVLAAGERAPVRWLSRALEGHRVEVVATGAAAKAALDRDPDRVLVVAERLLDGHGADLVVELHRAGLPRERQLLACEDASALAPAALESVYYVIDSRMTPGDVAALVEGAAAPSRASEPVFECHGEAGRLRRVLGMVRRLAGQADLRGAGAAAVDAVVELTDADRAHCLFHDAGSALLWNETCDSASDRELGAARGLAGFAARAGRALVVDRAASDPRYVAEVDDPTGSGDDHLLVQPVTTPDGVVHAVLIAVRGARRAPFSSEREGAALAQLAERWSPLLAQLVLDVEADAVLRQDGSARQDAPLFRREALDAVAHHGERGDVVRVSPRWVGMTYWLLLGTLAAGVLYGALGSVVQYSSGPAVVRVTGRTAIPTRVTGEIAEVAVAPGQEVAAGDVLVRFRAGAERAELAQADREWEDRLREYLLESASETAREALAASRTRVERARSVMEERVVRAPHAGRVTDVLVREGMHLAQGDLLLSIGESDARLTLVALLPGRDRPRLVPGMPLRLELSGYEHAYQDLVIEAVHDELLGPAAARRFLGPQVGDSLAVDGAVVVVKARLESSTFDVEDRTYTFHDGMLGTAEVATESRSLLASVIPGLDRL